MNNSLFLFLSYQEASEFSLKFSAFENLTNSFFGDQNIVVYGGFVAIQKSL